MARHKGVEVDTLIDECAPAEAKETHGSEAHFMTNVTGVHKQSQYIQHRKVCKVKLEICSILPYHSYVREQL